jgi:hypothetical protein
MDFQRKLELVEQSIRSISKADDMDAAVRTAALDRVDAFVKAEREAMAARVEAKIKAHLGKGRDATV